MTAAKLSALLALAAKATPGPWRDYPGTSFQRPTIRSDHGSIAVLTTRHQTKLASARPLQQTQADAAYIAACSPEVVAALVRVAQVARMADCVTYDTELGNELRALSAALGEEA